MKLETIGGIKLDLRAGVQLITTFERQSKILYL